MTYTTTWRTEPLSVLGSQQVCPSPRQLRPCHISSSLITWWRKGRSCQTADILHVHHSFFTWSTKVRVTSTFSLVLTLLLIGATCSPTNFWHDNYTHINCLRSPAYKSFKAYTATLETHENNFSKSGASKKQMISNVWPCNRQAKVKDSLHTKRWVKQTRLL